MVVYHSLNYSTDYRLPFRYLAFLPPSFILISGFLLTHVSLARRGTVDAGLGLHLLVRGAKLLALFSLLNVASQFARSRNYHGPARGPAALLDAWPEIFLTGGSRLATFDVLLPIAYLLLLAPVLLTLQRRHRLALPALAAGLLVAAAALERHGTPAPNLELLAVGVAGLVLGRLGRAALARTARLLPLALALYAAHYVIGQRLGQPFLHQALAAFLALAAVYGASLLAPPHHAWTQRLVTLGRYSLVAYIAQIAFLQLYSHLAGRPPPASLALLVMLGAALLFTSLVAELIHALRRRFSTVAALYRWVMP